MPRILGKALLSELAGGGRDDGSPPPRGRVAFAHPTTDAAQVPAGIGSCQDLLKDCQVFDLLERRVQAVVSRDWRVVSASERPADVAAAEEVRSQLAGLDLRRTCEHLLDAILCGYSVVEVVWTVVRGQTKIRRFKPMAQDHFFFAPDGGLRFLDPKGGPDGVGVPDGKVIVHHVGTSGASSRCHGLGQRLFWPVFFKNLGFSSWQRLFAVGRMGPGAHPTVEELARRITAAAGDAWVVVPEGMPDALLAAFSAGTVSDPEALVRFMDERITAIITWDDDASGGAEWNQNPGTVPSEGLRDHAQIDADGLSRTLDRTICTWITRFCCQGAEAPHIVWSPEDQRNEKPRGPVVEILSGLGDRYSVARPRPVNGSRFGAVVRVPELRVADRRVTVNSPNGLLAAARRTFMAELLCGLYDRHFSEGPSGVIEIFDQAETLEEFRARLDRYSKGCPPQDVIARLEKFFRVKLDAQVKNDGKDDHQPKEKARRRRGPRNAPS